jgi:eukaryotic-like serine/threonine-protein kinase
MEQDPNINEQGFPIILEYGRFEFIRVLDSGGQGTVCLYKTLPHREVNPPYPDLVAVKFDPTTETNNLKETLFLKDMNKRIKEENLKVKIPEYIMHSFNKGRRFFVMTYLPHSIEDLVNSKGAEMKEEMTLKAAVKMLDAVEQYHKLGYLHRDIKPSNFRVKDGEVYITDFGTTIQYLDAQGVHIKE